MTFQRLVRSELMLSFSSAFTWPARFGLYTGKLSRSCLLILVAVTLPQWGFSQNDVTLGPDQQILQFLNRTVEWYQHRAVERQAARNPGDVFFTDNGRSVADGVLHLSFEFARAATQVENTRLTSEMSSTASTDSHYQALAKSVSKLDDQVNQSRAELESLRQKLETVPAHQRKAVESSLAEVQSELALLEARRDVLHSILQFMSGAAEPSGLASRIDALERTVPAALARESSAGSHLTGREEPASVTVFSQQPKPSGIWGTLQEIVGISEKLRTIDDTLRLTDELSQSVKQMQDPLRHAVQDLVRQSDAILNQPDSQDPAVLAQQKSSLDGMTAQFKLISTTSLPLSKEAILLDVYRKNLGNWRSTVNGEYSAGLKKLLVQLLSIVVLVGVVLAIFDLWRRAILRYVPDLRRRYQFLLLRRIALWFVITLIVVFGLASELGSIATFAGLMTAGVAVALQNVILAAVGYFLLIGKFGVRVGDRVQIAGVTGEVVEIGLIRLHVMELAGTGGDLQPTGRVVGFSNSVVFQPTPGVFKQAPGTSFVWHEISLTLAPDSDYRAVEKRILGAVDVAFKQYQEDFERQRRQLEMSLNSVAVGSLAPKVRFRLTAAGLEVLVRFPVELRKAVEIDDGVTREILGAIEREPKLKVVGADVPTIRLRTDNPAPDSSHT